MCVAITPENIFLREIELRRFTEKYAQGRIRSGCKFVNNTSISFNWINNNKLSPSLILIIIYPIPLKLNFCV